MKRSSFLDALAGKNYSKPPPIWLMRQAGRYLASYKRLRERCSFETLCMNAELAAEVTLLPIEKFDLDAAIIFSDILFPLTILGATASFPEGEGPKLSYQKLYFPQDIKESLKISLAPVYQAIRLVKKNTNLPLIGFSGAAWTLFAYLIEKGKPYSWKKTIEKIPTTIFQPIFKYLERLIIAHLELQIEAGCDAVQIFDSLSFLLPQSYLEPYSLKPLERILQSLPKKTFCLFYRVHQDYVPFFERKAPCALSFDTSVNLPKTRLLLPSCTIQGNIDPLLLCEDASTLKQTASSLSFAMRHDPAFIFNVGSGLLPQTKEENVQLLIDTVREVL